MSFRKYAGDYRLENIPDKKGVLKTEVVYRGAYYRFTGSAEELASAKPRLVVGGLLFCIAQIISVTLNTRCARCMWVILPQSFAILAGALMAAGIWTLLRAPERMTREYAEKTHNRINGGSLMAMLLSGAAFISSVISAIVYRAELMLPADIFYIILLFVSALGAAYCFVNRRASAIREY
ncbi:MAG: hypothetical protein E7559_03980 [Ruminococcaceae bacterium]|nr:hypothetical protein [Oscillospiraceae bacterium]